MRRAVWVAGSLLALAACAEPLEFSAWLIEIPQGVPILENAAVPMDERNPNAIRLVDEFVISPDLTDPHAALYRPTSVVASEEGTIFVADSAANRIQMLDSDGNYLKTLGKEGQGPGEFQSLTSVTIAGDLLVVDDSRNNRLSTWTLDGEHVADHQNESTESWFDMEGLASGSIVARSTIWENDASQMITISSYSLEGREVRRLDEVAAAPRAIPDATWTPADFGQAIIGLFDDPARRAAVGAGEIVYLTPLYEYQLLAMSPEGEALWALRAAVPRPPVSSAYRRTVVAQANSGTDAAVLSADDLDWSAGYRAVASMLVDGAGRLYVVHEVGFNGPPPDRLPTDVYSPEGDLVAAGFVPIRWAEEEGRYWLSMPWSYAEGEYVYGLRDDDQGERVVVRYRLELSED